MAVVLPEESTNLTEVSEGKVTSTYTTKTQSKKISYGFTSDSVGADGEEVITSSVSKVSRSSKSASRTSCYEIDSGKQEPKIFLINRTEPVRFESKADSGAGASTETTINLNFKNKRSTGGNAHLEDGFAKVATNWEADRNNLHSLNTRLGSYIDTVRSLEVENKSLVDQLASLKANWVNETMKVKEDDGPQLQRYRKDLENAEFAKARIEVQLSSIEDRFNELQRVFDEAQQQNLLDLEEIERLRELVAEYESELTLLRKRVLSFDTDSNKDVEEITRLKASIEKLRVRLDEETENHIVAEHIAQTRREEIEFMKAIQEAELKELTGLIYKETSSESKGFWRNELAQALEEIAGEYERRVDEVKFELEMEYEKKTVEHAAENQEEEVSTKSTEELAKAREESAEMKSRCKDLELQLPELQEKQRQSVTLLADLRRQLEELQRAHDMDRGGLLRQLNESQGELDHIMKELQLLLDSKLSLDLQIAAYRKLIEGEESRSLRAGGGGGGAGAGAGAGAGGAGALFGGGASGGGEGEVIVASSTTKTSSSKKRGGGGAGGGGGGAGAASAGGAAVAIGDHLETSSATMTTKTSFKKTNKGPISIREAAVDGKYIKLQYKSKNVQQRQDIGGWKLTRQVEGNSVVVSYEFPEGTIVEPEGDRKTLLVWARGFKPADATEFELELTSDTNWGMGSHVTTLLFDKDGEEKASNVQSTVTSGVM